ncbi:hypothetical protein [Rhodobacter viridis]
MIEIVLDQPMIVEVASAAGLAVKAPGRGKRRSAISGAPTSDALIRRNLLAHTPKRLRRKHAKRAENLDELQHINPPFAGFDARDQRLLAMKLAGEIGLGEPSLAAGGGNRLAKRPLTFGVDRSRHLAPPCILGLALMRKVDYLKFR